MYVFKFICIILESKLIILVFIYVCYGRIFKFLNGFDIFDLYLE